MSADSTMCHVYAMNRKGEWFPWTQYGWGWKGDEQLALALPQMEAIYKAKYVMDAVPWTWGVKVVVLDEPE